MQRYQSEFLTQFSVLTETCLRYDGMALYCFYTVCSQ